MIVLVTGGAGYIGSLLVRRLLSAGHEVRVLDRLDYGGASLLGVCDYPGFHLIRGDVTDRFLLRAAMSGADAVVHLAARVGFPACQRDPQDAVHSNVEGTRAVTAVLEEGQQLVYASTASVYGAAGTATDESRLASPLTLYARTKLQSEDLARERGAVILRFSTAFGVSPRMRFDLLPNDMIRIILRDGCLDLYEPQFRRSFVHVRDAAAALHHALGLADGTFNVSNPTLNMTKRELAELISRLIPYKLNVISSGHDSDERDYYLSADKFAATGFRASADMTAALRGVITAVQLTGGT